MTKHMHSLEVKIPTLLNMCLVGVREVAENLDNAGLILLFSNWYSENYPFSSWIC